MVTSRYHLDIHVDIACQCVCVCGGGGGRRFMDLEFRREFQREIHILELKTHSGIMTRFDESTKGVTINSEKDQRLNPRNSRIKRSRKRKGTST